MTPRSKRQKRAPAKKGEEAQPSQPSAPGRKAEVAESAQATAPSSSAPREPTLDYFFFLPRELQFRIVELACRSPEPAKKSAPRVWGYSLERKRTVAPLLDVTTTFSLLLASKELYNLTVKILYHDVMLYRPSALVSFHQAITAHPQLGALVVNLHAGPIDALPDDWYPLEELESCCPSEWSDEDRFTPPYYPSCMQIRNSIQKHEQPLNLYSPLGKDWAKWHVAGDLVPLDPQRSCRSDRKLCDFMLVAQRRIDVSLEDEGYRLRGGTRLAGVDYTSRLFEAQAVLDLCYYEIARRQSKDGLKYPADAPENDVLARLSLSIEGYPIIRQEDSTSETPNEDRFILTRADILRQIARPGSATDRFDSPLLFARSGIDIVNTDGASDDRRPLVRDDLASEQRKDWADLFSQATRYNRFSSNDPTADAIDPSIPHIDTLGSLLAQLRAILLATPNIENLSLTGFLERAICGSRSVGPLLPALRALSLGPPPEQWLAPMLFDRLTQVQELRIAGVELLEDEAACIADGLPGLQRLQWSFPGEVSRTYAEKLPEIINLLVGRNDGAAGGAAVAATSAHGPLQAKPQADEADDSPSSSPPVRELPIVDVRLQASDLEAVLGTAPSEEIKAAWKAGSVVEGQARRLMLVKSKIYSPTSRWWEATNCWGVYNEGREWWDEQGGLVRLSENDGKSGE